MRSVEQDLGITDTPTELPSNGKHSELEIEIIVDSMCIGIGKNLWAE